MPFGMSAKELSDYFQKEYMETNKKRQTERQAFEDDLVKNGIPRNEAKILSLSQINLVSAIQAVSYTIEENNKKIETQLKDKGITF